VTFVLSVHGRDTLWMVVDRRLSYEPPRKPIEHATKILSLETTDGVGLLGYAGLGTTAHRTEPSAWMSAVLRGRGELRFEQALLALSDAANRELPRHLEQLPRPTHTHASAHFIVVPAFVNDVGARLYGVDNVLDTRTDQLYYRCVSHQRKLEPGAPSIKLAIAGTGGDYLAPRRGRWARPLRRLIKAHDRGSVSDHEVADHLARLNLEVHQGVPDGSVGPRCIVAWRRRPDGRHGAGGGHLSFTGVTRDTESGAIPTIATGVDIRSHANALLKHLTSGGRTGFGGPGLERQLNPEVLAELLDTLPSEPDERLR
jgi:hypothetical protein